MPLKVEPISTEHSGFTTDLSQVKRAPELDNVLMADSVSVNMCSCCGRIFLGGHDRRHRQFVALPVDPATARAIAENLTAMAAESEKLGHDRRHKH